jgi:hypothetical protein
MVPASYSSTDATKILDFSVPNRKIEEILRIDTEGRDKPYRREPKRSIVGN